MGRAVRATHTITFIGLKPGLLTLDGPDHCGEIVVADLGVPAQRESAWVASPRLFQNVLRSRPRNFHKGMAGSLGILGGATGMSGAALLAGRAALKLGAGRVYVGMLDTTLPVDPVAPELMLRHADDALGQDLNALVVGPGLGQSERAETLVGAALASELPCLLDADALNLIAESGATAREHWILTPHPGEAGRLLDISAQEVQRDRLGSLDRLLDRYHGTVVLKGAGTLVGAADRTPALCERGNPGMATAGTGDVLTGTIAGILAQCGDTWVAARVGVLVHALAGDAAARGGERGVLAGDLLRELPHCVNL
jgi:hydroxyethylthiazole kinase-like uncharacterized protein yjeF